MHRLTESGAEAGMRRETRAPGLDLLRASAILAVLLFHLASREASSRGWPSPPLAGTLGYFGVELFFILSGFLIGRILIRVADSNPSRRDWLIFLVRRWMRTLPLYFLWLVVLLVILPPPGKLLYHALLYSAFAQSLAWPMPADNWFGVSWSLAVEEWFYLLFSVVLVGLAAARVRNAVQLSCLLFLALPLAARIFLVPPTALFDVGLREISLLRLDAIAYGVIVAWIHLRAPDVLAKWQAWLFFAGCFMLLGPIDLLATFGDQTLFATLRPFIFNFTSIGFALWIPAALGLRIRSGLLDAAVRWLSERSYCLYIVHLSVIEIVWHWSSFSYLPALLRTPVVLVVSAGLAEVSFRFLEAPLLRLRPEQFTARTKVAADSMGLGGQTIANVRASRAAG